LPGSPNPITYKEDQEDDERQRRSDVTKVESKATVVAIGEILAKKCEAEATLLAFREELLATEGRFLPGLFAPLFAEHPEVVAYQWVQYTPYFDRGGPGKFLSYHYEGDLLLRPVDTEDEEFDESDALSVENDVDDGGERCAGLWEVCRKFMEVISVLSKDDVEALFGNDRRGTVYRDRVETAEYNPG
jgi:hypothetical protein